MTSTPVTKSDELALTGVLASGLPANIEAGGASRFYDVPAVFNRRPHPQEIVDLESNDTRDKLRRAGYPDVTLAVHDRRLVIEHTNLGELERGLATVIATTLRTISVNVLATLQTAADNAEAARDRDLRRAQDITRAAERITFTPEPS